MADKPGHSIPFKVDPSRIKVFTSGTLRVEIKDPRVDLINDNNNKGKG